MLWIPAHSDYEGNEYADSLAKKGSQNSEATSLNLPTPQAIWKASTHQLVLQQAEARWNSSEQTHFKKSWRDDYTKVLARLNRQDLRIATQVLTGHAAVNYHLHKYKPRMINKTCPFCKEEDETINHFIGKCPKWFELRGRFFNTYYASLSEIQDTSSLTNLINFVSATGRLDPDFVLPVATDNIHNRGKLRSPASTVSPDILYLSNIISLGESKGRNALSRAPTAQPPKKKERTPE